MGTNPFSWLSALGAIRGGLAADVNEGLLALRALARVHPLQGFELELVGRILGGLVADDVTALPEFRVAVMGGYTTEPIANAARVALLAEGYWAQVYEAPFGSFRQEIFNPASSLYSFKADAVVLAISAADIENLPVLPLSDDAVVDALDRELRSWRTVWDTLATSLGQPVLQHVFECPEQEFLGPAERRAAWTSSRFVDALNQRLAAVAPSFVRWVDVDRLAARVGRQNWHDLRLQHHARFGFSVRFLPDYSHMLAAAIRGSLGTTKKALILDLDNTLWGGVIGDDRIDGIRLGPDTAEGAAHQAFCRYVKHLGHRGVILGICSKNDFDIAVEVFEQHPHMPLRLSDFAAVRCNWGDKATNLRQLAHELNIDLSTFVFVDDNPAECELIRRELPEVRSILLDGDPASFIRVLDHQHLFDGQAFSVEDTKRTESYRARAQSAALESQAPDLGSYLESLEMKAQIHFADSSDLVRLAQMEMKTNQFNLTTRRLTLEQLQAMVTAPDTRVLTISLADRFADHGLVSYLAARVADGQLLITDWLMSCRVFARTLEQFTFNRLVDQARALGVETIVARYVPTAKNAVIAGLLEALGFRCVGTSPEGPWEYSLGLQPQARTFVSE